jgi:hypothetical protein
MIIFELSIYRKIETRNDISYVNDTKGILNEWNCDMDVI